MTRARARSEGSAIINEYESDKTKPNEAILTASLYATRKEVDKKLRASSENESINENELMHAIRNIHKIQETAIYRNEDEENKAKFEAKNRVCIRCEHKRDTL